jgi:hypothetical protein
MKYNLPRGYLSHSSLELWRANKQQYRLKYYGDDNYSFSTMYTEFGKEIATILEDKKAKKAHPVLCKIPAYSVCEHELQFEVDGVPIKGYIDSYDPKKKRIIEYKTSIKRTDGKQYWNPVSVKKHNQMLLYALGVRELEGDVHPLTKLIWMETDIKEVCKEIDFGGGVITDCQPGLYLTGHFEVFKRKLEDWEFDWMRKEIVKIATEISDDYTAYCKASGKTGENFVELP